VHSDTRFWRWSVREVSVRWSERWITKRDSISPSRLSGMWNGTLISRDDSDRELRSEKKKHGASAMNNVRYIHFSERVRFPSASRHFFVFKHRGFHLFLYRNKKRFHHQALIEVRILEHLRKKDLEMNSQHNVIHMLEYFYFRNHLCISFELMRWAIKWDKNRVEFSPARIY